MFSAFVSTTRHLKKLIEDVRSLKNTGVVMESDERAQQMIALLQSNLKDLFKMRFEVRSINIGTSHLDAALCSGIAS